MEQIIARLQADVTGDGKTDAVYLTGVQAADSVFWEHIMLNIQDGACGRTTRIALEEDAGYDPRLFIGSLTARGSQDILVSIDSGGSGAIGYYSAYRYEDGRYRRIFSTAAYNEAFTYRITYLDDYAVRADSLTNGLVYMIDLSNRDEAYRAQVYTQEGTLKTPQEGFVDPLSLLYPADVDSDGVMELVAWQKISGLYHADTLGNFINTLQWEGDAFTLRAQTLGIEGTPARAGEAQGAAKQGG